jgi:hypothetical protein
MGGRRQVTVVARTWDRLTIPGKALFILIPLLAVLTTGWSCTIILFGGTILDILVFHIDIVRFVVAALVPAAARPAGRVRDHLHGDEDHRPHEPPGRTGPGGAMGLAPLDGARPEGPHEGGLHSDPGGPRSSSPGRRSSSSSRRS